MGLRRHNQINQDRNRSNERREGKRDGGGMVNKNNNTCVNIRERQRFNNKKSEGQITLKRQERNAGIKINNKRAKTKLSSRG